MLKLKQMASVAAAVVGLAFGMAPATASPTIDFQNIVLGAGTVDVDVVVGNLGSEIVSAYDLDVTFGGALSFEGLDFSTALGGAGDVLEGYFDDFGLVDFFSVSLLSDADLWTLQNGGPVTLATLHFTGAEGVDASSLAFAHWGTDENNNTNDVKGRLDKQIIPEELVPEPATYALVGVALLAAGLARRRRSA